MAYEQTIAAEEMPEQTAGVLSALLQLSCAPVFAQMLPIIRQFTEERFDTATSPDGAAWPVRKFFPGDDGHPLLVDTGALAAAAIGQGTGAMEQLSRRELMVGIDGSVIEYAAAQNYGYPPNNLPQREFFGIDEDDEVVDQLEELLSDYVYTEIFGE